MSLDWVLKSLKTNYRVECQHVGRLYLVKLFNINLHIDTSPVSLSLCGQTDLISPTDRPILGTSRYLKKVHGCEDNEDVLRQHITFPKMLESYWTAVESLVRVHPYK